MIRRETVLAEKRAAKKFDYHPNKRTIDMLADACLELLDLVDGGADQRDWATERAVADAQVAIALIDLDACLAEAEAAPRSRLRLEAVIRARYTITLIREMLRAKLSWRKQWDFYRPRIEEEFGDNKVAEPEGDK